jgi:Mn-dependent DtxR family transcriptional regulator
VLLSLAHRYEPASASAIAKTLRVSAKHVARALRELARDERVVCVAATRPTLWVAA